MATQRSNLLLSIFLFMVTFFYLHPTTVAIPTPAPAAAPTGSNTNAVAFILSFCHSALYPNVCYSSLSRYANTVNEDPTQLARVALSLSLTKARRLASYIANFTVNDSVASSLHDCSSSLEDAVDQIRDSVKQFRRLISTGSGADSFTLQISNVQTWMSAGLTNVDSCMEELESKKDGAMKMEVVNRVKELKKLTSNALAIVNRYAHQIKA